MDADMNYCLPSSQRVSGVSGDQKGQTTGRPFSPVDDASREDSLTAPSSRRPA